MSDDGDVVAFVVNREGVSISVYTVALVEC